VYQTRAGWLDQHEITEVWFDPKVASFEGLLERGVRSDCAQQVWTTTPRQFEAATAKLGAKAHRLDADPRPDKEPKYYLLKSAYRHVPMTAAQASRCNAALAPGAKNSVRPEHWLSPRQQAWLKSVEQAPTGDWPIAVDVPITEAWARRHK
jgi:hypothetical protein